MNLNVEHREVKYETVTLKPTLIVQTWFMLKTGEVQQKKIKPN